MVRDEPFGLAAIGATSQFAALEPIWAGISSARQLRALLVFGALFNERVFVHDTQLIDNPRVVGDFGRGDLRGINFYRLLRELVAAKVVAVGLRNDTYLRLEDRRVPVNSLADVLSSWKKNSPDGSGWVISPISETRERMVADLDGVLAADGSIVVPYDHALAKDGFMRQVRAAANSADSVLAGLLAQQPSELRRRYDEILAQPQFSHAPVFALLRDSGLPVSSPLVQIHGLFDETAHADLFNARILGSDWDSGQSTGLAEAVLAGDRTERSRADSRLGSAELMETAYRMVEGPPPDLLAMLRLEEIMELRERAAELFEIQSYFEARDVETAENVLETALADCAADHWQRICEHIRATRPHQTVEPTRLGIFLRRKLPRLARVAERWATSGLSTLTEVAISAVPLVGGGISDDLKQRMVSRATLEFVFFTESSRMRELRDFSPNRSWISPSTRSIEGR
ncbi:hypothetical protein ABT294_25640 [Nonomuraea sp. NPDC000554]|uniref:hypothetical protein n=1 Tax=Nonomuraea sp. NPDC000554 TaxID=3154259 RepID=UPI00332F7FE3